MPYFYSICGLWMKSDAPVPCLMPTSAPKSVDVRLHLGKEGPHTGNRLESDLWYTSPEDDHGYRVNVYTLADGAFFHFQYSDGASFVIDQTGTTIWATWSDNLGVEDAAGYLLGHILGFVLGLRGYFCMHASAVALEGGALAFMAPSGCGKSTTAAAFAGLGYPMLTDDILALSLVNGRYVVQPAYPRLGLWPEPAAAIEQFFGTLPRISPHHPTWNKRYLDLGGPDSLFQPVPLRLAAIYTGNFNIAPEKCGIEKVVGQDSVMTLLANRYRFPLIPKQAAIDEFAHVSRMAATVPIRRISFHRDLDSLPQLCDMIVDDFHTIRARDESV